MEELLNPTDSIDRQRDKLMNICAALMRRVEQTPSEKSSAYAQFERAALLDAQVRQRTADLERALDLLNDSNAKLAEANRETEKSRAILNDAIESVDEGLALFDADDTLLLFNSRFCKDLVDVRSDLRLGMSFEDYVDVISSSAEMRMPPGMTRIEWRTQRMQRHREEKVVFNTLLTRDRWMQVSEHRTSDGGTAIVQTDISDVMREQYQERAELVANQDKMLRATLDHLAQGVCIFDHRAQLVGWNRELERMIQIPEHYIRLGTPFSSILELMKGNLKFVGTKSRTWLLSWAKKARNRGPIEFELNDIAGRIFHVFAQEMPDRGFVMSISDITSERTATNELRDLNKTLELRVAERTEELGAALRDAEQANTTKNRFVAAASHDLLQPFSAAKLYLATLQETAENAQVAEISQKAENALKGAEDIIEALLDISKLDAGHAVFDVRPFSLGTVLTSLFNEFAPIAQDKGLELAIEPSVASIVSDAVFFRRVMQNLIGNAIKYTDAGRIFVGVRDAGDGKLVIEVEDTGAGIAVGDQQRIFQEFTRLEDSHSGAKGIGLGLAIVERVCTSLGHELDLQSTPGRGSCFSVTVDRYAGSDVVNAPEAEPSGSHHAIRGKMLLLVENDEELAHAMTLRLERGGAHVVQASSGEEALALLAEIELLPDAALLDFQLGPGMNGLELHETLRANHAAVPTFILSANRSAELRLMCDAYRIPLIAKPIDVDALLQSLDAVFRERAD